MNLPAVLRRDIAGRKRLIATSDKLIERWEQELKHPPSIDHSQPLPRAGVDFAWGRPLPHALRLAGVTFVGRYLGGSADKDLTRGEAEDYSAAGLDIVTFFESTSNRSLEGYNAGAQDAKQAASQLRQIGAPPHAAVYFTDDSEPTDAELPQIAEYIAGAADHLGSARVGIYGGLLAVSHVLAVGRARYGCQTIAWSDGRWSSRAQLRQTQVSVAGDELHVAGTAVDRLEAITSDFGQWRV
jgi:Domain of unknown function (DUF1906)